MTRYEVGDRVVYTKDKHSTHPGPRARDIFPSTQGEDYRYSVDKYWTVSSVVDEDTIEVMTRRGKRHLVNVRDPHLRKASLRERLFLKARFPVPEG